MQIDTLQIATLIALIALLIFAISLFGDNDP